MSVTELGTRPQSRTGSTDLSKMGRTRIFYVNLPTDGALTDPDLPQRGTLYPGGDPNTPFPLTLDRYDIELAEDGNSYVTCHYTNDRSGRLNPTPDTTRPGYQSFSISFQETASDFPTVMTFPLRVPGESGSSGTTPTAQTTVYKITETLTVFQVSAVVQGLVSDGVQTIGRQNNTIHVIKGRAYRFKAGDVRETEKGVWETIYTWIEDPGTPVPRGAYAPAYAQTNTETPSMPIGPPLDERVLYVPPRHRNLFVSEIANYADSEYYVRSPFSYISFFLQRNAVPQWTEVMPYRIDPTGWQRLPGGLRL